MSSQRRWKRLIFRWRAWKGFAAMVAFLTLAVLVEYLVVYFFLSLGLMDESMLTTSLQVPLTDLLFTVTISPLFHLIPLGVIAVLVSSWTYLTKSTAVVPRRREPAKQPPTRPRSRRPGALERRLRPIRRFSKKINRKFQRAGRAFKAFYRRIGAAVLRIRGVSYVSQRLFFARAAVRSTATVLVVFLGSVLALCILGHPRLIHDAVVELYSGNPSFLGFASKTIEIAHAIAQTLSPIGWLASAINNALLAAAPSFRNALGGLGSQITEPMVKLDLVGKYVVCQNVAAWASAVTALAGGRYTARLYRRKLR